MPFIKLSYLEFYLKFVICATDSPKNMAQLEGAQYYPLRQNSMPRARSSYQSMRQLQTIPITAPHSITIDVSNTTTLD